MTGGPNGTKDRIPLASRVPEEVWFFLRITAYAFFIGTVYWFLTYEPAGTMLLYGFGIATGFGAVILGVAARRAGTAAGSEADEEWAFEPDGPFGDESGRIPAPSLAPFAVGLGAALTALSLVFGPWLAVSGAVVGLAGALEWLLAAGREYRATERSERTRQ